MQPVADLGSSKAKKPETCDITVGDILGPLKAAAIGVDDANSRDANFSLLSYSFSLVSPGSLESLNIARPRLANSFSGSARRRCIVPK